MEEGDYTFGLKDVMLSDWNAEEVPYTAEGASVHVTELPKEPQLLTVQWSGNASMSVEGNAEEIISTDAIYGAKVQPGEELTFTFTPTDGAFSGSAAQRRGHRVCSGRLHVHLHDAGREHDPVLHVHKRG